MSRAFLDVAVACLGDFVSLKPSGVSIIGSAHQSGGVVRLVLESDLFGHLSDVVEFRVTDNGLTRTGGFYLKPPGAR